jgi:hypothetical protein
MQLKRYPTGFNMGVMPPYSRGEADANGASDEMLNPSHQHTTTRQAHPDFSKRAEPVDPITRPEIHRYRKNVYVRQRRR